MNASVVRAVKGASVRRLARIAAFLALCVGANGASTAQTTTSTAILTTPHFAFHSDFATNLNQTLVADFVARRDKRPGLFETGSGKACFDALPSNARDGWGRAAEYYRTNKASPIQITLLRLELAGLIERAKLEDAEVRPVRSTRHRPSSSPRSNRETSFGAMRRPIAASVLPQQ